MEAWGWHNQYSLDYAGWPTILERAPELNGMIVKASLPDALEVYKNEGIPLAVESYIYPHTARVQAEELANVADGVGAKAIVLNAEVEWEDTRPGDMSEVCEWLRSHAPEQELWYCVDTRGGRAAKAYQIELMQYCCRCIPMIYPLAYYPSRFRGYVAQAFADALVPLPLAEFNLRGIQIHPAIQLYGEIGADAVRQQVGTARYFQLPGISIYTIGHATEGEWRALMTELREQSEPPADVVKEGQVAIVRVVLAQTCLNVKSSQIAETLRAQLAWLEAQSEQPES